MASKRFSFTFSDKTAKKLKKIPKGQRSNYIEKLIAKDFKINDLVIFIKKI